jgi:hypothetical protein
MPGFNFFARGIPRSLIRPQMASDDHENMETIDIKRRFKYSSDFAPKATAPVPFHAREPRRRSLGYFRARIVARGKPYLAGMARDVNSLSYSPPILARHNFARGDKFQALAFALAIALSPRPRGAPQQAAEEDLGSPRSGGARGR